MKKNMLIIHGGAPTAVINASLYGAVMAGRESGLVQKINGGLIALTRFTGEIGFYPNEYLEIIERYFSK